MGQDSKIQWTHHTFNPWVGCSKVSPGCQYCYAEADMDHRRHFAKWGVNGTRRVTSDANWRQPLRWDREAREAGERRRVFCASLADVFEDREELIEPRNRLANLVWQTQNLDYLFLTKRPQYAASMTYAMWFDIAERPRNYWLGTSVEDQERADERVEILRDVPVPSGIRFLSVEPLLGPIRFRSLEGISWVIVGGESGHNARPCDLAWIRSIRDQCRAAGVSVFIKQLGARPFVDRNDEIGGGIHCDHRLRIRDSKGGDLDEWPEDLRIREFPNVQVAS